MSQESLNSNNPWENEELTEAELDALAGGDLLALNLGPNILTSETVTLRPTDSLFTSYPGARGTVEVDNFRPLNLTLAFP